MAVRPVFVVMEDKSLIYKENIEFEYFSGFSDAQKRKSINSLHSAYHRKDNTKKVLEISSKSEVELGVKLSAFNLMIKSKNGKSISVESVFQSSKVFENGGTYKDLLEVSSKEEKKDKRLINSGRLIGFIVDGKEFETDPKTFFYNWLYVNALYLNDELAQEIMEYDAFTDIVFNPQKSINCQAEAAAIFVSLKRQGLLEMALKDKDTFKIIVYGERKEEMKQMSFM